MLEQFERSEENQVSVRLRAFRGARTHLVFFASFELLEHGGWVAIERCCSCRSPSS